MRRATFRLAESLVFPETSWNFTRDQNWAVLGPNGSGKSLFADALRGQLPLVGGELRYHFRPPAGVSVEETIGHVSFEDRKHELHDHVVQSRWNSLELDGLQVGDFLSYEQVMQVNPFEVTQRHNRAQRAFQLRRRRAISLLRIEPLIERRLISLSNGETQRVRLARALCQPLRLLILDEPFLGLDSAMRAYFQKVLAALMAGGLRVLLLTTREEDVPGGITHVMRIERCSVVSAGKKAESLNPGIRSLKREPLHRELAGGDQSPRGPGRTHLAGPETARRRTALVRLRNVTVRYGSITILRDLDWTVYDREHWALLGPNGSGKSTLLSLLLGDNPQAYMNEVEVLGRRRGTGESIWELKRKIGWVSAELQLHFSDALSCFEVVASGFHQTIGVFEPITRRQQAAARQGLERFGLLEFAGRPLFTLSTGLQRMALLARALVTRPRLLVLDEPCQGLDATHRNLFVNTVDGLFRTEPVTGIYVTHREDEIPPSVSKVMRLRKPSDDAEPRLGPRRLGSTGE